MAENIEIKARYADHTLAREKLQELNADFIAREEQTDTFYHVTKGRLKLREINRENAFLIPYLRDDHSGPRSSEYTLLPVPEPAKTKELLALILGVTAIVHKKREIYRYQNVRIHLDEVKHLGAFIEFEAVQNENTLKQKEQDKLSFLTNYFGIQRADIVPVAYVDLLSAQNKKPVSAG